MSATTLPLVAAMLLMAAIEIAVACCVWLRVDDECCGCGLFDAVVIVAGAAAVCMVVAAGMVRLLFTWQLAKAICRAWSFCWLRARTSMLKTCECC